MVCDSNPAVLAAQAKLHPQARCTPSLDDVLADAGIDAVVVAVDAGNHFTVARAALTAGKHVLVEKPLTLEVAHSAELIRLAARVKRKLMVGHLLLYHPVLEKAKLLWMYDRMSLIREFEERLKFMIDRGLPIGAAHYYSGEEAVAGVARSSRAVR